MCNKDAKESTINTSLEAEFLPYKKPVIAASSNPAIRALHLKIFVKFIITIVLI